MLLGFDTSTPVTAVGVLLDGGEVLDAYDDPPPGQRPGHASRLLPLAADLLARVGAGWRQVERVAVGLGPGSFTGLRIGVATARGLAQSLGVPVAGVSSLRALAVGAASEAPGATVMSVIDAGRGEAFVAAWAGERQVGAPDVLAPDALAGWIAARRSEEAPPAWLGVGTGAVRFRSHLQAAGVVIPADGAPAHRVGAAAICLLGADAPPLPPEAVLPDYHRRPDAETSLRHQPPRQSAAK